MNTSTTLQWLRLVDDVASHVRLFKSARYKYKCPLKVGFTQNTTYKNNQNPISGWRGQTSRPRNHLLWFWGSFIKIFMPPRFSPWYPSWILIKSNLCTFPNFCDQLIFKNDNNFHAFPKMYSFPDRLIFRPWNTEFNMVFLAEP